MLRSRWVFGWVCAGLFCGGLAGGRATASGLAAEPAAPVSFHHAQLLAHQNDPVNPDLISGPVPAPANRSAVTGPCKIVFGYLPYWESSANIQWDRLTHLAAFSIQVNESGNVTNAHGWPWTSIVNTAHANGVKVHLVVTLFDGNAIVNLITSPANKANFFENMRDLMIAGNADGINIDFEGGSGWQGLMDEFMGELSAYMEAEIPGSETSIATAPVNWSSAWQFDDLVQSTDIIFIMGYNYYYSGSSTSGPVAPLTGGSINITNTVVTQYASARAIAPERIVLGLPYYGLHMTTQTSAAYSPKISFIESPRYRVSYPESQIYGVIWDANSQTPWYRYQQSGVWHQVWFDNAESIDLKYDLVDDYDLGGVGMWALNYDGTLPHLWDVIDAHYVAPCCEDMVLTYGLLADNFDDGNAAGRWNLYASSSDYTADFYFDYSQHGIPPAPNATGGSTRGLKLTVNKNDANPTAEAVSLYPAGRHFSGNYALKFDLWLNYNGGSGGGIGSTEFAIAGLGQTGDRVVWPANPASDGKHFWVSGEGGASDDYRAYNNASIYAVPTGVYSAGSLDSANAFYQALFPAPDYETPGAPGKHWVEVEVRRSDIYVYWFLNGVQVARAPTNGSDGNVLIGYADVFSSLADPAEDNFLIVDNVRVELVSDLDCNANTVSDACETFALGDFDADGDSDLADLIALVDCLDGPGRLPQPASAGCAGLCLTVFDADGDQDVDLADFHALLNGF